MNDVLCKYLHHALYMWLASLQEAVRTGIFRHSVWSAFDLAETIRNLRLRGMCILPLEVASPITGVPMNKTIIYICECFRKNGITPVTSLDESKQLLLVCIKNFHSQIHGEMYQLMDGVVKWSRLWPFFLRVAISHDPLQETSVA